MHWCAGKPCHTPRCQLAAVSTERRCGRADTRTRRPRRSEQPAREGVAAHVGLQIFKALAGVRGAVCLAKHGLRVRIRPQAAAVVEPFLSRICPGCDDIVLPLSSTPVRINALQLCCPPPLHRTNGRRAPPNELMAALSACCGTRRGWDTRVTVGRRSARRRDPSRQAERHSTALAQEKLVLTFTSLAHRAGASEPHAGGLAFESVVSVPEGSRAWPSAQKIVN